MSTPQPPGAPEPPPAAPSTPPESAPKPAAPPPPPAAVHDEDRPSTWQPMLYLKIGLLLVVVGYVIAFVVQNTDQIKIDFVFKTAPVRLIWTMLLLLAIGLVGGVLLSQLYRHRRRTRLTQESRKPGDSRADVGRRDEAKGKSR